MRVLMTTDTVGGVWNFTCTLTGQLLQRGHEVHLVSFGRTPSADQEAFCLQLSARFPDLFGFTASDLALEWMQGNEEVSREGFALLGRLLNSTARPDLLLSNQFCFGALPAELPRIVVAHSDVLSWAQACRGAALDPSPWLTRYTAMVQAGLRAADAVVAPTFWMAKALVDHFAVPHGVEVIANGAEVKPTDRTAAPRKLQAITAGRLWDEAKGLDIVHQQRALMPILVAGDPSFEGTPAGTAWPNNVTSLGSLSQAALHQHFQESAVYLCCSRYEPFGLAPLEAALCGCAVVCRDIPSLREVWQDSALFFTDQHSLTRILDQLGANAALLATLQRRALGRAQEFTPARLTDNYLALVQAVLRRHEAVSHVA